MGLDLVELVIRIEETFSIQIPDRVAAELTTPRKVSDFILTQVDESQVPLPCISQKTFHMLRRGFINQLSLPRRQFRVDTALGEIVPEENRADVWKEIGSALGAKKWPAMSRPKWLSFMSPEVQSVRDLTEYFVTNEPLLVKGTEVAWSRAQVEEVLRRVIEDETALKNFTEDSRFVEDMHLD
ncbi:MAG TPA: phosphopantetheine-binding protein [Pyrinomonadaceae bacterium]|nr:phosphopantetheine-binding protein [Pyrinomonadaceae bacterium]